MSDLARRINAEPEDQPQRFIFATFDARLRSIARLVLANNSSEKETGSPDGLAQALQQWWPADDARQIVDSLFDFIGQTRNPDWCKYEDRPDYVGEFIVRGEAVLRSWVNPLTGAAGDLVDDRTLEVGFRAVAHAHRDGLLAQRNVRWMAPLS